MRFKCFSAIQQCECVLALRDDGTFKIMPTWMLIFNKDFLNGSSMQAHSPEWTRMKANTKEPFQFETGMAPTRRIVRSGEGAERSPHMENGH